MLLSNNSSELLAKINYPLYTVHCLSERYFLVAGGGGEARTGVQNAIEIFELIDDGKKCTANSVTRYDIGHHAIMNSTSFYSHDDNHFILFTGMERMCQLYKLKLKFKTSCITNNLNEAFKKNILEEECVEFTHTNNRNSNIYTESSTIFSCQYFEIQPLQCFQTDFMKDDPFQKLVKCSPTLNVFATAGSDGHVRFWNYPHLNKLYEINAHFDDVDDFDFSPVGDKLVTASRDGHCKIWDTENGLILCDLKDEMQNSLSKDYVCRNCRISLISNEEKSVVLYVSLNPVFRTKPRSCLLSKWDINTYSMKKIVSVGDEILSAMAVSDNGCLIGLGTQEGSVKVYDYLDLQLLYYCKYAHSIFVTGLEFLKCCQTHKPTIGGHDASLISISVDNDIKIHYISHQDVGRCTAHVFLLFLAMHFITFILMDYINL